MSSQEIRKILQDESKIGQKAEGGLKVDFAKASRV